MNTTSAAANTNVGSLNRYTFVSIGHYFPVCYDVRFFEQAPAGALRCIIHASCLIYSGYLARIYSPRHSFRNRGRTRRDAPVKSDCETCDSTRSMRLFGALPASCWFTSSRVCHGRGCKSQGERERESNRERKSENDSDSERERLK